MTEPTLDDFIAAGHDLARAVRKAFDCPGSITGAQMRNHLERFEAMERAASQGPPKPCPSPEIVRALLGSPSTIRELVDVTGLRAAHMDVADLEHAGLVRGSGEYRSGPYGGREGRVLELTSAGVAAASRLVRPAPSESRGVEAGGCARCGPSTPGKCAQCGEPIVRGRDRHGEIIGIAPPPRSQGGQNHVIGREDLGRPICNRCAARAKKGISPHQATLGLV